VHRNRSRREVMTAVGGAAAVVLGTALMVWLLRPGTAGAEGTGGLASRQPRAAWLVGLTLIALVLFVVWAWRRQGDWRGRGVILLLGGGVVLLLGAVLAGILWPGGLLRHTEAIPTAPPPGTTEPNSTSASTTPTTGAAPTTVTPTTAASPTTKGP
jgi:hypothetical protein